MCTDENIIIVSCFTKYHLTGTVFVFLLYFLFQFLVHPIVQQVSLVFRQASVHHCKYIHRCFSKPLIQYVLGSCERSCSFWMYVSFSWFCSWKWACFRSNFHIFLLVLASLLWMQCEKIDGLLERDKCVFFQNILWKGRFALLMGFRFLK